jgi:hypothetical protein
MFDHLRRFDKGRRFWWEVTHLRFVEQLDGNTDRGRQLAHFNG